MVATDVVVRICAKWEIQISADMIVAILRDALPSVTLTAAIVTEARDMALAALSAVEWVQSPYADEGELYCPWCLRSVEQGHAPGCSRQRALTSRGVVAEEESILVMLERARGNMSEVGFCMAAPGTSEFASLADKAQESAVLINGVMRLLHDRWQRLMPAPLQDR